MMKQHFNLKIMFLLVVLITCFATVRKTQAETHYVSQSGSATWSASMNPSTPCSLSTANNSITGGDIAILRGGFYSTGIAPVHSGSNGSEIIYQSYTSETPIINDIPSAIDLDDKNYITIDGISVRNITHYFASLNNTEHSTIKNCSFIGSSDSGVNLTYASYIKLLDNYFDAGDECAISNVVGENPPCLGDTIGMSWSDHVLIEGNNFGKSYHGAINFYNTSTPVVIRKNDIANIWHTQIGYGNCYSKNCTILVEENIIRNAGMDCLYNPRLRDSCRPNSDFDERYHHTAQIGKEAYGLIFRKNVAYNNGSLTVTSYSEQGGDGSTYHNRIYNNVFDQDKVGLLNEAWCDGLCQRFDDNIFKNNAISRSEMYLQKFAPDYSIPNIGILYDNNLWYCTPESNTCDDNYFRGSYGTMQSLQTAYPSEIKNSLFVSPMFVDWDKRNYSLSLTSPLIDAGTFLTTTANSGSNSTNMTVADAGYFTDGWGITDGDTIKLQNGQKTTITNVNYSSNTITLSSAISWTQGIGVSLDFEGNAPDIGAKEYGSTAPIIYCGDSTCNGSETCSTCPQDCGTCTDEISKTSWTLHYVDSEELINEYTPATYAFDNNINTFWHTPWETSTQPHEIQINLNSNYSLTGLRYLPRQDGGVNGTIKNYEFYTSTDGTNWMLKSSGSFSQDTTQKEISFSETTARYVRLKSLSEINNEGWASAAEITLLGEAASGDAQAPSVPGGLMVK